MMKQFRFTRLVLAVFSILACLVPTFAGALGGPVRNIRRIDAYDDISFVVRFRGGEVARVGVIGDGDTDLDLYVYDSSGNLVAMDQDETDRCLVQWRPRRTETFVVRVKNRGGIHNNCLILTN